MAASQGDNERILVERLTDELLSRCDPLTTEPGEFLGEQFDAGLAFVQHPIGLGGLGVSSALQSVVDDRLRSAKAKSAFLRNPIGVGLGIPVLRAHGTAEQQQRYYRPAFRTEEIWCQLFSEPGSGSDLAGLATRAVPDGDEWVVNGQKVWTSMAHVASVGMLLARTDPDRPKHEGLSFFLLDMHAPGVDVRPLKQMTGDSEFNEVFLTDVRIPSANLVGDEGAGWRVSTTTLFNERLVHSGEGSGASTVGGSRIEKLIAAAADLGVLERPTVRDELVRRYMESRVIKWTNLRARDSRRAGHIGPEGSITKLFQGLYNRRLQETAVAVQGAAASAWLPGDQQSASVVHGFFRAQGNTLEGGTSEILRNVLGERMLGLPRDPGFPSTTPWSSLPRNG